MALLTEEAIDRIIAAGRRLNEPSREQPDAPAERDPLIAQLSAALGVPIHRHRPEPIDRQDTAEEDLEAVAETFHQRTAHRRMPSQRQMRKPADEGLRNDFRASEGVGGGGAGILAAHRPRMPRRSLRARTRRRPGAAAPFDRFRRRHHRARFPG